MNRLKNLSYERRNVNAYFVEFGAGLGTRAEYRSDCGDFLSHVPPTNTREFN